MINWDRIRELKTEILCEDFSEVFDLFLEEVEEVLERMRNTERLQDIEADFHFLKGSAVNVGFTDFGDLCCAGEMAAANGNVDLINLELVQTTYQNSLQAFLSRCDEPMHAA